MLESILYSKASVLFARVSCITYNIPDNSLQYWLKTLILGVDPLRRKGIQIGMDRSVFLS